MNSRSPIVQTGIRLASPIALLLGTYLLFAGHNRPGGGFAAGLVFGSLVTLRTITGMQRPRNAIPLLTAGMLIVVATSALPLLWGDVVLDMIVISQDVPLLGTVKSGTALPFDIGVTAIVVGMIVALLDGLGSVELLDGSQSSDEAVKS